MCVSAREHARVLPKTYEAATCRSAHADPLCEGSRSTCPNYFSTRDVSLNPPNKTSHTGHFVSRPIGAVCLNWVHRVLCIFKNVNVLKITPMRERDRAQRASAFVQWRNAQLFVWISTRGARLTLSRWNKSGEILEVGTKRCVESQPLAGECGGLEDQSVSSSSEHLLLLKHSLHYRPIQPARQKKSM